jgi:hypothetical protein
MSLIVYHLPKFNLMKTNKKGMFLIKFSFPNYIVSNNIWWMSSLVVSHKLSMGFCRIRSGTLIGIKTRHV